MKVTLTYHDSESFTIEEVVRQAVHNYGKAVNVEIMPESTKAYDLIYFGIQQLTTHKQLRLLYDSGGSYQQDIKKLRSEIVYNINEIIDQVIIDNEAKVG